MHELYHLSYTLPLAPNSDHASLFYQVRQFIFFLSISMLLFCLLAKMFYLSNSLNFQTLSCSPIGLPKYSPFCLFVFVFFFLVLTL